MVMIKQSFMNNFQSIGVITWHYYQNYGSMLQAYALVKTLRDLGYRVRVINYRNPKFGKFSHFKRLISNIIQFFPVGFIKNLLPQLDFPSIRFRKFFNETREESLITKLEKQCSEFDAIICGSDQIWAPNVFNPIYLLNFVPDNKRKISYAASIGLNQIPSHLIPEYKKLLSRFYKISVRESSGSELLLKNCNIRSTVVLDPTLLIASEYWHKLSVIPKIDRPYIFCYILKENHGYKNAIIKYGKRMGLPIYGISACKNDYSWMNQFSQRGIGPKEFLGLIENAYTVITDSYHGTIFSLLFHKRFISIQRFSETEVLCQNSRIEQLKAYFPIESNVVQCSETTDLTYKDVDWNSFESELVKLRTNSTNYLKESLKC